MTDHEIIYMMKSCRIQSHLFIFQVFLLGPFQTGCFLWKNCKCRITKNQHHDVLEQIQELKIVLSRHTVLSTLIVQNLQ